MKYFNKLPGFIKTPSGLEWILFKKIPHIFLIGTAVPCISMLTIYYGHDAISRDDQQVIYQLLGVLFSAWFFVGTLAIGCIIVILMKGPAYVADPYELPQENRRLEKLPHS
ncbi:MAG: hypothetical protein Q8J66_03155 [Methylotenera sp.]|nr:hypothetical protein [Methylotenera sp.]